MIGLVPNVKPGEPLRVLCLGAHPDDLEIGCAATIQALCAAYRVHARWVVFSGAETPRENEARQGAERTLASADGADLRVEAFRDAYFPYDSGLKEYFERELSDVRPDLVLTHARDDRHQDHRTVSDLTWNTFRRHLVLEYEVPKYDGDLGRPNVFVPIPAAAAEAKIRLLMDSFPSQTARRWFDEETFRGLMRIRGLECGSESGYAEAFHGRKVSFLPAAES